MNIFRGDIFYIMPGNSDCYDLKEGRPGIIVSNNMGNTHSDRVEVVFLTTKDKKPMPTHVEVVCRQKSTALCEQIHTIFKDRLGEFIRTCTSAEMKRIDEALMVSLGVVPDSLQTVDNEENDCNRFHDAATLETIQDLPSAIQTLTVERDLYRQLYEQLLDRITG